MKKSIIFLLLIFLSGSVFAEEIARYGKVTKETNPIYWGYMEDYAQALKEAFEKKRIWHLRGMGSNCKLIISRDGQIKQIETDIYQNDYFDRKVREVISSVKPIPFYDGMNLEDMLFSIYLGYQPYEEVSISVGYHLRYDRDIFHISIDLDK